jgi:hypothetical protein
MYNGREGRKDKGNREERETIFKVAGPRSILHNKRNCLLPFFLILENF